MFSAVSIFNNPIEGELYKLRDVSLYHGAILSFDIDTQCNISSCVTQLYRLVNPQVLFLVRLYNKCFLFCTEDTEFLCTDGAYRKTLDLVPLVHRVVCLDNEDNLVQEVRQVNDNYVYKLVTEKGNAYLNNLLIKTIDTECC